MWVWIQRYSRVTGAAGCYLGDDGGWDGERLIIDDGWIDGERDRLGNGKLKLEMYGWMDRYCPCIHDLVV